jgi:hypothetical protein
MKRLTDFSKEDDILSPDHEDAPGNVAIGVTHVYPVTHTRSHFTSDDAIGKITVKTFQCCGSMTLWYGSGFKTFNTATKTNFLKKVSAYYLLKVHYIIFQR